MGATIRQILFVPPAPLVWANHLGAFAKRGIEVQTTQTQSSDELGQRLADGSRDIGIGVMDNVIAWNAERSAGLQIVAQLERSTLMSFCCVPQYASLSEAARHVIAVDSTTNGFVLVLYRALARQGIDWRRCAYDPIGGVKQRFDALAAGKAASTILVPPFDDMAVERGFRILWQGRDIAPAYPGVVVCARASWLKENQDAVTRYLRALLDAGDWARNSAPAARQALIEARYSEKAAERLVRDGVPGLAPAIAGWEEVMALRRECGLMPAPEPDAASMIDSRLLALAAAGGNP